MNAASSAPMAGLAIHRYPAVNPVTQSSFVLLHGWGCDSRTWQPLLPHLQRLGDVIAFDLPGFGESVSMPRFNLDDILTLLEQHLPERATLVGWSLGGMLAVALAARTPQKAARVITLAANVKFVANAGYSAAMPMEVNQQFNQSFSADEKAALKLFSGLLAQGDANERGLLKSLRVLNADLQPNHNWREALTLLATLDNREDFSRLSSPGLHIFGEHDALVPVAAAYGLNDINARQQIAVVPQAAHALHWSQPEKVMQLITEFLQPAVKDKRKVAGSFSRAAKTYDSVANLQRDIGLRLLADLSAVGSSWRVLDLGCGTGFFSDHLLKQIPGAEVIGLDLAEGMLHFARSQRAESIRWICSDAENLPLQNSSVDIVFSNLAIQWCDNLPRLFAELRRILKPGGYLIFSTLGPATLHELKNAWQTVDRYVHVNRFQPAGQVQTQLAAAEFEIVQWRSEKRVLGYARLVDLTRELKALGAHNINRGQAEGLTGRSKLEALRQAYEQYRSANLLPATYEVFYGVARPI